MYKNPTDFFLGVIKTKEVINALADRFEGEATKALEADGATSEGCQIIAFCQDAVRIHHISPVHFYLSASS